MNPADSLKASRVDGETPGRAPLRAERPQRRRELLLRRGNIFGGPLVGAEELQQRPPKAWGARAPRTTPKGVGFWAPVSFTRFTM